MKTLAVVLGLGLALAVAGCSDDSGEKDKGVTLPDGGQDDTGGVKYDTGGTQLDTGGTKLDTGGTTAGPNSGQTCDQATPCPTGDVCAQLQGWTKGMCVSSCPQSMATCQTADQSKYLSLCAIQDPSTQQMYCMYICGYQGQTYECPDPATQDCVDDTQNQGVKVCQPKSGTTTPDAGI